MHNPVLIDLARLKSFHRSIPQSQIEGKLGKAPLSREVCKDKLKIISRLYWRNKNFHAHVHMTESIKKLARPFTTDCIKTNYTTNTRNLANTAQN